MQSRQTITGFTKADPPFSFMIGSTVDEYSVTSAAISSSLGVCKRIDMYPVHLECVINSNVFCRDQFPQASWVSDTAYFTVWHDLYFPVRIFFWLFLPWNMYLCRLY